MCGGDCYAACSVRCNDAALGRASQRWLHAPPPSDTANAGRPTGLDDDDDKDTQQAVVRFAAEAHERANMIGACHLWARRYHVRFRNIQDAENRLGSFVTLQEEPNFFRIFAVSGNLTLVSLKALLFRA